MSTTPNPQPDSKPSTTPTGDALAVEYVQQQLVLTRAALRQSRIVAIILIAVVLIYMSIITPRFKNELSPKAAAKTAVDILSAQVEHHANDLSDQIKQKVPQMISELPEMVLRELPKQREALEGTIEAGFREYCLNSSKDLEKHLDLYLDNHKDAIQELMTHGDNKDVLRALGNDLENELIAYLDDKPETGESIKFKIDESLKSLQRVEAHMERLATATDLTPQEKKARRAIAILTHAVGEQMKN